MNTSYLRVKNKWHQFIINRDKICKEADEFIPDKKFVWNNYRLFDNEWQDFKGENGILFSTRFPEQPRYVSDHDWDKTFDQMKILEDMMYQSFSYLLDKRTYRDHRIKELIE